MRLNRRGREIPKGSVPPILAVEKVFVTGILGFMAAGEVVRLLGEERVGDVYPWVVKRAAALASQHEEPALS
jgi:hypothetical protein